MVHVCYEISKEDFEKAKENGAISLIGDDIVCGYGVYCAEVYEKGGQYYLAYDRGATCD